MYSIMSSTNNDSFTFSFPIWIPFCFFHLSDCHSYDFQNYFEKKIVRVECLFLFLTLEEMILAFHCWVWCLWRMCHIWPFVCWGRLPLCPLSGESFFFFYHKWVLNFVKSFLCIYWDGYITFIIQFVDVVCRWFVDVEISLNPWDTPTWLCCMMLLMCCWIWFASTCWRFLCLCSSVVLGSIFLVFVVSLSGFAIRVMVIS